MELASLTDMNMLEISVDKKHKDFISPIMKTIRLFAKYIVPIVLIINTISCGQGEIKNEFNKSLADKLDSVLIEDQKYRKIFFEIEGKYGVQSKERNDLGKVIREKDSINKILVTSILDNYGWLGREAVGENGSAALYLVIQHSDPATQEKYLPMMREAVRNGKALGTNLAYLEDRVALGHGRKQIYGSQLYRNDTTLIFYFAPIEDEANVNKRRASVGLNTIEDRAREFGFEYKISN